MPHDLAAERQIADVVLADLERQLVGLGPGEELRRDGKGVLDQARRHAVIGDDEKPGVFAGAGDGARQRRRGAGIAGEIRPDVEHRNAAVIRNGHGRRLGGGAVLSLSKGSHFLSRGGAHTNSMGS